MAITLKCSCGKSLKIRDDLAGKKIRCPGCKKILVVPAAPPPAEPAGPGQTGAPDLTSASLDNLSLGGAAPGAGKESAPAAAPDLGLDKPLDFGLEEPAQEAKAAAAKPADTGDLSFDLEQADTPKSETTAGPRFALEAEPGGAKAATPLEPAALEPAAGGVSLEGGEPASKPPAPAAKAGSKPPLASGQAPVVEPTDEAFELPAEGAGGAPAVEGAGAGASYTPKPGLSCPRCSATVSPNDVVCVKCGAPLGKKKAGGIAGLLADKKKLAIVGGAAALVAAAGIVVALKPWAKRKAAPPPAPKPAAAAPAQPPPGPQAAPPAGDAPAEAPKPAETPKPVLATAWKGFARPLAQRADLARRVGEAVAEFTKVGGKPPEALASLSLDKETAEAAGKTLQWVPAEVAGLKRFRALAMESAEAEGARAVVFSDGTAALLPAAEAAGWELRKTPQGWLTPGEIALLADMRPALALRNERLVDAELLVDGKPVLKAKQGETASAPGPAGVHEVALRAGGVDSRALKADFRNGMRYEFALLRHTKLRYAPEDAITSLSRSSQRDPQRVTVTGGKLAAITLPEYRLKAQMVGDSSIRVHDGKDLCEGRPTRIIEAALLFDDMDMAGPLDEPLGIVAPNTISSAKRSGVVVNHLSRLASGDVYTADGSLEQYRILDTGKETRFGVLALFAGPGQAMDELCRLESPAAAQGAGERAPAAETRGEGRGAAQTEADPLASVDASRPERAPVVDVQELRPALLELGQPALSALAARVAKALGAAGAAAPAAAPASGPGAAEAGQPGAASAQAAEAGQALLLMGAWGGPKALEGLAQKARERPAIKAAAVLALGLARGELAAQEIEALADKDRGAAVLALAMLDDAASRTA
ncbi:MAG TPA: hypothetical protein P5137_11690, partial [Candidatus Brocadiia bacterium]|nr:hypothetical protein [Candidatus Brocadiia bacterium]